jgi:peptidoglycan hydrolase CwlO-like protein
MNRKTWLAGLLLGVMLSSVATAQARRDPLTETEVDQLREVTQEPVKRVKLLVKFARARMLAIEQLRADPKLANTRGKQMHDLLEDFDKVVDELDRNLDMYSRQKNDLRKPLKEVIEAYTEWQLKLRAIKQTDLADAKVAAEMKEFEFPLDSAIDTVNAGLDTARELMDEQNERIEAAKKKK